MTPVLYLGPATHSSWSLRAWLLFERFGLPVEVRHVPFDDRPVADRLVPPARTVPTVVFDGETLCWDSLAIAEELASRHPTAGIWPEAPAARATARSLAAEMHSGFAELRAHCPMNLAVAYAETDLPATVADDLARIETLWSHARRICPEGPWLCGPYSAADAFFAPVAARIAGYALAMGPEAEAYMRRHLADPAFRRWRAMGLAEGPELARYHRPWPRRPWPDPA